MGIRFVDGRTDPLFQALRDIFPGWACVGFAAEHPTFIHNSGHPDTMEVTIRATFHTADYMDLKNAEFFNEQGQSEDFVVVPVDRDEEE